ncbi:MAG TPA: hypothetical protein VIO64_22555 [Pseudobacteroides sp.]|uniref:hypothetical protein n=1 Tax=Pseudobacteroides sp. TaxID=1968840 RepID=UPI002F93026B
MSIKVFGVLELPDTQVQINKQVELSFIMIECATKNKIGIKVGGNVAQKHLQRYGDLHNKLPFELTDDPMDVNAECLFAGDGIEIQVSDIRVDSAEPLLRRMSRVQNFLKELTMNNIVNQIILDVNIEDGDEFETIKVSTNEFSEKMVELYEQEGNWTPTVRIIIK